MRAKLSNELVCSTIGYNPTSGELKYVSGPEKGLSVQRTEMDFYADVLINLRIWKKGWQKYTRKLERPLGDIAWCCQTGKWPMGPIMFRDGNPKNLTWGNLYEGDISLLRSESERRLSMAPVEKEAEKEPPRVFDCPF